MHRDLKPENILIEKWSLFTVVIADFGLAKAVIDNQLLTTFCGTANYAAPKIRSKLGHGLKVDTWSLGVMVLEWIYGLPKRRTKPKSKGSPSADATDDWVEQLLLTLNDQEECLLTELLSRMINVDPTKRWSAAQCLRYGTTKERLFRQRSDGQVAGKYDLVDTPTAVNDNEYEPNTPRSGSPPIIARNPSRYVFVKPLLSKRLELTIVRQVIDDHPHTIRTIQ